LNTAVQLVQTASHLLQSLDYTTAPGMQVETVAVHEKYVERLKVQQLKMQQGLKNSKSLL
jgi:hypothetical protein